MSTKSNVIHTESSKKMASVIAKEYLFIDSLEEKFSDRLDFHEVSVVSLEKALLKMFELGQESVKK